MFLITGAGGKTGKAILREFISHHKDVRAIVHSEKSRRELLDLGVAELVSGDLLDEQVLETALEGVAAVYHICPNMHPQEEEIGLKVISAAKKKAVQHFIYHSVLHPQVEDMPHHWHKLRVEELLLKSGIPFTILQPAAYMQNVLGYWQQMMEQGIYSIPYSVDSRSSMVDLEDLAEAAYKISTQAGHLFAIYELCSHNPISARDIAKIISEKSGRQINAVAQDRQEWDRAMQNQHMPDYARSTLMKMFAYYEQFDFIGNSNPLSWILERTPNTFETFIDRILNESYWE